MSRKIIDIGAVGNDGTGDSIRDSFRKVNDNFQELYSSLGLGERLTFIGLSDAPNSYVGQNDPTTGNTPIVTVNNTESGLAFKRLAAGNGISIDFVSDPAEITINANFAEIKADTSPKLGGDLSMRSGGNQYRILDAGTTIEPLLPIYKHELVNKNYADTKVSRAGTSSINPETGVNDPSMGRMSGPLILARDPEPDDDTLYNGLVAATKRYVDSSAFGSSVNLYVATSGADDRVGVSKSLQGRALAYAYRTLEAALKRAEELINEAREEIGPYKKVLTYNDGAQNCTLDDIGTSPASGTGFSGSIRMSVNTVTLSSVGSNYYPGDILTIAGGTVPSGGGGCTIQVLTTLTTPGSILTYKIISTGSYSALPGSTNVGTTITTSAAPSEVGAIGAGATFNVTYKVNSVVINNGGSGYSLVSVRITGGGGAGAFGSAIVESGVITSITITDKGTGFTSLPTLSVDLPRFFLKTEFFRTDFTGDVLTNTPEAARGRDIREGLYLRGETSGALAQILSHQGSLDSEGREIFDVDVKYGSFIEGEVLSYGDISKNIQISILVESGEYYENYPLKVPANVSIVGDEFRRVIFRPRPGVSSSPWAFQKFRRDLDIDGLVTATQEYGYHYLSDPSEPVYPKIANKGSYTSAATLIDLNRSFLQEEIIAWMDYNIDNSVSPFTPTFSYSTNLCKRDVGLLVDSLVFDLKYGGYNRTISAALKYYQSDSSLIAITSQLDEYLSVLTHLEDLIQDILSNTEISGTKQNLYPQIIDPAYQSETGSSTVITALVQALKDIIDESGPGYGSVNQPKDNVEMDVFLANDAVRWQAISAIGHGGFMGVLDPEGQILSRSPYFQECASFSRSKDRQTFAGGMFVDGFAGNLEFVIDNVVSSTRLEVSGLERYPQIPCSFIVGGNVYRVNYIRDFVYGVGGFSYNTTKCSRDVNLIATAILNDFILGTNYKHVTAALSYLRSYTSTVTLHQKSQTIAGLNYARDRILDTITDTTFETAITNYFATVTSIIDANSVSAAPALTWTAPSGISSGISNGWQELINNRTFLMDEITAYINSTQNPSSITGYNEATCRRDVGYFIDAFAYDLYYGGNSATVTATSAYFNGSSTQILGSSEVTPSINSFTRLQTIIGYVIQANTSWTKSTGNTSTQSTSGGVGSTGAKDTVEDLIQVVIDVLTNGVSSLPATVDPTFSAGTNYASHNATKTSVVTALPGIREDVILFINASYSEGSRATFILDETTPWPFDVFTYNSTACRRDVGLILDGLGYDITFGTNYWTRTSGSTYRMSQSSVVIQDQRDITLRSLAYGYDLAKAEIDTTTIQTTVDLNSATVSDIIDRGTAAIPTLTFTLPANVTSDVSKAYTLLMANRDYVVAETEGWIAYQISHNASPWATGDTYNSAKSQRDVKLVLEATVHDLIYGGNLATRHAALKYYNNITEASMLASGQPARCASAITYAAYVAGRVVQNLAPATSYSSLSRTTGSAATSAEANTIAVLMDGVSDAIAANDIDSVPAVSSPTINTSAYTTENIEARVAINNAKETIQDAVVEFVNRYGNRYEMIMPGNRSMLANDFTQVNDMGYGAVAVNGGLLELVSIFTYYCYVSYYSLRGGQIRSVSGSSSHGVYALVAEGADPLEVPTPTTVYTDYSQKVLCYYPSPSYANTANGLFIYVYKYDYTPLGGSELEINHNGEIYRYPVTSVTTQDLPDGVARLNLTAGTGGTSEGLSDSVAPDAKMTLRSNNQVLLTGGLADVAVRPSTGLKLRETSDNVYRVLQFTEIVDDNGPYEISISSGSSTFKVLEKITTITSNVCTTSKNHRLKLGDKFIPTSTSNGLTAGTTYYVVAVPEYDQFELSLSPGGATATLTNGTGLAIKGIKTHKLLENYTISFSTTGTLPTGINDTTTYWVLATDLTDTEFTISSQKNGIAITTSSAGTGTHSYAIEGLTLTNLRENYNYLDLTIYQPGEYTSDHPDGRPCTISVASPAIISISSHGFNAGDVVKFTTTGELPTGLSEVYRYFVLSSGLLTDSFKVSLTPGGTAVDTSGTQSGIHSVGKVTGRAGDSAFAVVPIASQEIPRVGGSRFVFLGEEYVISTYESESATGEPYARITLDKPLVDAVNSFSSSYTIKSAVPTRSSGSLGTLTIRISLTRVTSHDLLEIGTGSYADTNYPKEIYGPSVNALNPDTETDERDVGRCFYVTTDQYGNFKVGPYFAVDQGTGQVTFSSSIALSNLDGLGFKRGVPIAEFSTDSGFTDNATDTVPTENATRIYLERRLGLTHDGAVVVPEQRIPTLTGGFLSLDGQMTMLGNLDAGGFRVITVADPITGQDAVNLQSLTFDNFQDTTLTSPSSGDILGFTGTDNEAINLTIGGDVTATRSSGNLNITINSNTIVNSDINANAAIDQSKLNMTTASARASASGITQADRGLASFDNAEFTLTNGWVTLKTNGVGRSKLAQAASKTVIGNSGLLTANVSDVAFSDVIDLGLGIKKSQYNDVGFLKRTSGSEYQSDSAYEITQSSAGTSAQVGADELIQRDTNGDFGGRTADLQSLKIDTNLVIDTSTIPTGGYVRYYGWGGAGSISIQDSTLAAEKKTAYWNDLHQFKNQSGLSDAPITCSSVQTLKLTTGGNTTAGEITGRWTLTGASPNESRLQATYSADLAEYYEGDKEYEVGTVLVFGGDKEVTVEGKLSNTKVAGVVSNTAGFVMYDACPGLKNLVALQGRVPVKVVGKVRKGDLMVTANIPGVAVSAGDDAKSGAIIGKALQDYDSDHIGTIEVAVGRT